jgi:hypothetical protein
MFCTGFADIGQRQPKRVAINSSAASLDLVAAVSGKRIRLIALVLATSGAGTVVFNSASTEQGRVTFKAADPSLVLPNNPDGWIETAAGEKLNIGNAGTLTITGFAVYVEI